MVDLKTGQVSREWYNFFISLFELTGNGQNSVTLTDLQQMPPVIPQTSGTSGSVEGRFYATLSSSTSLTGATDDTVVFDSEVYDDTGEYNPATGVFTAAEDSEWAFTAGIGYRDLADQTRTRTTILVNGTDAFYIGGDNASGAGARLQVSSGITLRLSAGDTVQVTAYVPSAGPKVEGGGPCYFYGLRTR